jgi:hypothetical protein
MNKVGGYSRYPALKLREAAELAQWIEREMEDGRMNLIQALCAWHILHNQQIIVRPPRLTTE